MIMEKSKVYPYVKFAPEVIREAAEILTSLIEEENYKYHTTARKIQLTDSESWSYNTDEEFFADFRKSFINSLYEMVWIGFKFSISVNNENTTVSVGAQKRQNVEAIFEVFEKNADKYKLSPAPEKPKLRPVIFIGHGGSEQWKELKDHLHEKHGYEVEAYEIGARAGHAIRDILEEMLDRTSFAILVMTGEDRTEDGEMRARQNVVHELGLFQGRLGFTKAIVLLEEGTEEFSNILGINQIRYGKGNIKETFGEVLATLRREFQD